MSVAFLDQSAVSLVAVTLLVALAAWARIARPCPPLNPDRARQMLAEEFPDDRPSQVWVSADGQGVVARAQDKALVLFRAGDVYVARSASWKAVCETPAAHGLVRLKFGEIGAPEARLRLSPAVVWPPGV
jgi:hypothetical protein